VVFAHTAQLAEEIMLTVKLSCDANPPIRKKLRETHAKAVCSFELFAAGSAWFRPFFISRQMTGGESDRKAVAPGATDERSSGEVDS
jgi:hypothetical protein